MRNELERKGAEDSGAASGTDDHQATPQHVKDAIKLANSGTDDRRIPSNLDYDANDFDMGCSDMILWRSSKYFDKILKMHVRLKQIGRFRNID